MPVVYVYIQDHEGVSLHVATLLLEYISYFIFMSAPFIPNY